MHQRRRCSSSEERNSRDYSTRSRSPIHYLKKNDTHYLDRNESPYRYSPDYLLERRSNSLRNHFDRHRSLSHSPSRHARESPVLKRSESSCYMDVDESSLHRTNHLKPEEHTFRYSDIQDHEYNAHHYNISWSTSDTSPVLFPQTNMPEETTTQLRSNYSPDRLIESDISFNGQIKSLEDADRITDDELYSLRISEALENKMKSLISSGIPYIQAKRTIIKGHFIRNWNNRLKSKSAGTLHRHSGSMSMSRELETSNIQSTDDPDFHNSNRLDSIMSRDRSLQSLYTHEKPAMIESLEYKKKNFSSAISRAPTPGRGLDILSNYQYPYQTVPGHEYHTILKGFTENSQFSTPTVQCAVDIKDKQAGDREIKPRLSGAGRKRLKHYLMQGMTKEEAQERALMPFAAAASTCSYKESKPRQQPMLSCFTGGSQSSTATLRHAVGSKDKQADDREKQPRLSGAGRKRFKHYLMQGMTKEEAQERALRPFAATASSYSDKESKPSQQPISRCFREDSQSSTPTLHRAASPKDKQADDREKKPRLSGAGKKRLRHYLMQGMTKEEAQERAVRPYAATASSCSYKESKPSQQPMLRCFTDDSQSSTPTFRRATSPKYKQADNREKKPRLPAAARKRYKNYLMHGLTRKEAQERARRLITAKASTCSDKVPSKEKSQIGRSSSPPIPSTLSLALGIIHASFPEKNLTIQQLDVIQESITDQIVALGMRRADLQPSFHSVRAKPAGWLFLKCADKATADWLKSIATNLCLENNVAVRVVEESEIPQKEKLVVRLPKSQDYSNEKILALIGVQNDLSSSQWRVLERIQVGVIVEMTIEVDERSTAELKTREYRLNYKFGHVQFRTLRD